MPKIIEIVRHRYGMKLFDRYSRRISRVLRKANDPQHPHLVRRAHCFNHSFGLHSSYKDSAHCGEFYDETQGEPCYLSLLPRELTAGSSLSDN